MQVYTSKSLRMVCASVLVIAASVFQPKQSNAETPAIYTDDGRPIFRVNVPDFWTLRTGGLRDIVDPDVGELRDVSRVFGMTPDAHPGIWVGMISPHGVSDMTAAQEYLTDIGPFLVQDADVQNTKSRRIAGYPARTFAGQGQRNGKRIDFTAVTIDLPNQRVAIAVVILEAGAELDLLGDINTLLTSVKSMP